MSHITGWTLVGLFALAGPAPPQPDRERVEWIELDAGGAKDAEPSGRLLASPEFLKRSSRIYHFGGPTCGGPGLSKRVMDSLLEAMRQKTLVAFNTRDVEKGEDTIRCIESIRLFAPD
jgi:hypothetical protein